VAQKIVGIREIREMFGISKPTARRYVARPDFPTVLGRVSGVPVWDRGAVERWGSRTLPLRVGRPPVRKPKGGRA
jgi:predicted DNA-binding transcriptional regulator AlpA